jgi:hypothetical protein
MAPEDGMFQVDCPTTAMQGLLVTDEATFENDVTVTGEASFASNVTVAGEANFEADASVMGTISAGSAEITEDLVVSGVNIESKFVNTVVHTFSSGSTLLQPMPTCPEGFDPAVAAIPASFSADDDLRAVETSIIPSGNRWKIDLLVKSQSPSGNSFLTTKNPSNAQMFVQTRCDPE